MGVPADDILEFVISSNTYQDALKSKPVLERHLPKNLIVIKSDFHMERACIHFNGHLPNQNLIFIEAVSTLDPNSLQEILKHERNAIKRLAEKE